MLIGTSTSEELGYVTPAKTLLDDIAEEDWRHGFSTIADRPCDSH